MCYHSSVRHYSQCMAATLRAWVWVWVYWAYECMRLFTLFGFNELQIVSFDVNHLPYSLDCFPHSLSVCVGEICSRWLQLSYHIILRMHLMICHSFSLIIKLILTLAHTHLHISFGFLCPRFLQLPCDSLDIVPLDDTSARASRRSFHQ